MKRIILALLCFCTLPLIGYSQQTDKAQFLNQAHRADSMYMTSNYQGGFDIYKHAIQTAKAGWLTDILYNASCVAAKANQSDKAFEWLFQQFDNDKTWDPMQLENDNDLTSLHKDPRWTKLINSLNQRRKQMYPHLDQALFDELMQILATDQNSRQDYIRAISSKATPQKIDSLVRIIITNDSINILKVTHILDTQGWVGKDKIGHATDALWLVIQHANIDVQKKYLPMLQQAAQQNDVKPEFVAMLEDRINLREGKPQRYGSQFYKGKDGKMHFSTLEDPSKVNMWRKQVGLGPIEDSASKNGIVWPELAE